jgi:hypothetical protein
MSDNPVTCGNCQTENDPGNDFCSNCGQPLTRSAEEGMVENQEAQDQGGFLGGTSAQQPGVATTYVPNTDTPVKDGLPTD